MNKVKGDSISQFIDEIKNHPSQKCASPYGMGTLEDIEFRKEPIIAFSRGVKFNDMKTLYHIETHQFSEYGRNVIRARGWNGSADFVKAYNAKMHEALSKWSAYDTAKMDVLVYVKTESLNGKLRTSTNVYHRDVQYNPNTLMAYVYRDATLLGYLTDYIIYYNGVSLKLRGITTSGDILTSILRFYRYENYKTPTRGVVAESTFMKITTKCILPTLQDIIGAVDIYGRTKYDY